MNLAFQPVFASCLVAHKISAPIFGLLGKKRLVRLCASGISPVSCQCYPKRRHYPFIPWVERGAVEIP